MIKKIISFGVLIPIITFVIWFWNAKADSKDVEDLKEESKEHKTEITEGYIVNREQSILIEQATKNIERHTVLMDKFYDKMMEK